MLANPVLLQKKYSRIINMFAKENSLDLGSALKMFYQSNLYQCIKDGVSDMHCRSDEYLVKELEDEYNGKL